MRWRVTSKKRLYRPQRFPGRTGGKRLVVPISIRDGVAVQAAQVERVFVAERGVDGTSVQSGRPGEVVERSVGVPGPPELDHRRVEHDVHVELLLPGNPACTPFLSQSIVTLPILS
jgi:hypothetical protein